MGSPQADTENSLTGSERYYHEPVVVEELERLSGFTGVRLLSKLSNSFPREETLVALARENLKRGHEAVAWKIIGLISDRIQLPLARATRLWRLTGTRQEEVIEGMLASVYEAVADLSDISRFWEIRFWVCFDRRLLFNLRRTRNYDDRYNAQLSSDDDELDSNSWEELAARHAIPASHGDPQTLSFIADALERMPEHVREAFVLKHWAGCFDESRDPADCKTIAVLMGVSGRTVRNYLKRAEQLLAEWREGEDEKDEKKSRADVSNQQHRRAGS